ncbi:MAG: glycosyltransferase [Opitutae bacterium]|nr:glycosyltransferase [Opitutae bacterium]MBT5378229.1 glycosyltransferase [Opitutae bacterium]MBT7854231.1 glycosyltransferase [Opitutae bacterium]
MNPLFWDSTKTGEKKYPASGIKRVAERLLAELESAGQKIILVKWDKRESTFISREDRKPIPEEGIFITLEIFSEHDRPGFREWTHQFTGKKAAIFHDAIPIRLPHITWPKSVARHPHYIKMLGTDFDQVLAVSRASEKDLVGYWKWIGLEETARTAAIQWGADFDGQAREFVTPINTGKPHLLQVGILEPRKNQALTLGACDSLWDKGLDFHLHFAGRANPHFSKPIVNLINNLSNKGRPLTWHNSPNENELRNLYANADLCIFPSIAEGCGLPVLEALWTGRPVLASNLACISENSSYGGVKQFDLEDPDSLKNQLQKILNKPQELRRLTEQASIAKLPTWKETASQLMQHLR